MVSVKLKAFQIPVLESEYHRHDLRRLVLRRPALLAGRPSSTTWRPAYSISLICLAFFATVIGFGCYLTLVQRIGADRAAYTSVMFPIVA